MNAAGISDRGMAREHNEDAIFIKDTGFAELPNLYIVADGMGGHKAGEVASNQAIKAFCDHCSRAAFKEKEILDYLVEAAAAANRVVYEMSLEDSLYKGMGTTFSVCVLSEGRLYAAHIGDSRIYAILNDELVQISVDHTLVHEMVRGGLLTEEEAKIHPKRNVITRALGIDEHVEIDAYVHETESWHKLLLCSDGLTNMLSESEILGIVSEGDSNEEAARKLVMLANQKGGIDNISVILLDVR